MGKHWDVILNKFRVIFWDAVGLSIASVSSEADDIHTIWSPKNIFRCSDRTSEKHIGRNKCRIRWFDDRSMVVP